MICLSRLVKQLIPRQRFYKDSGFLKKGGKVLKKKLFKKLLIVFLGFQMIMMSSCFYETKTSIRKVPIYANKQVTPGTDKDFIVTPIIPDDNLVIAFVGFEGGDKTSLQRVSQAIKSSFINYESNADNEKRSVKHISRDEILKKLSAKELESMDPEVEKKLNKELGINVICSLKILKDESNNKSLSINVKNYNTNKAYNLVFCGTSWESLSAKVAGVFLGTEKPKMKSTKDDVLGYKTESYEYKEIDWNTTYLVAGMLLIVVLLVVISSASDSGETYDPDSGGGHQPP